jgi:hypothetical protein
MAHKGLCLMASGRSMQERYLSARNTNSLKLSPNSVGSADVMIAAGRVAARSKRRSTALAVWGVLASERMQGANEVADTMAKWIHGRSLGSGATIKTVEAFDVAMAVLKWWRSPACPSCGGHGHPLIPNSPVIDEIRDCPECNGTGKILLHRIVRPEYADQARWLSDEVGSMCNLIFGEMARELNADMDFINSKGKS